MRRQWGRDFPATRASRRPARPAQAMARSGCGARVLEKLEAAALWLRAPAERVAGSLRSAVASWAVVVGGYTLLIGSLYTRDAWRFDEVSTLVATTAGFSFITAIMDIVLLFGILVKQKIVLKYTLCAAMAVYQVCMPLSVIMILGLAFTRDPQYMIWEIPRIGICLLHLGIMYCLLVELRGDLCPKDKAAPPPADGWLKNNLTHHCAPIAHDEVLLKVNVEPRHGATHLDNGFLFSPNKNNAQAAPVHNSPTAYGPPSSTEA